MLKDVGDFLPDIQSINPTEKMGCVLFCDTNKCAVSIQYQLMRDFNVSGILDIDDYGAHYVVPSDDVDKNCKLNFIRRGWSFDCDQKFIEYLITFYNEDVANKIYNILIAHGYNVILLPNNMQLVVKCLANSPRNVDMQRFKCELEAFEKNSPQSMDDYLNKILFQSVVQNAEYCKIHEQTFDVNTVKENKDLIIRSIVYQYMNKKIRTHLNWIAFPNKFDANKLDNKNIRNVILVRDFLYFVATQYVNAQIEVANQTQKQPIIRFDYLKICNEYDNFKNVLKLAKNWQSENDKNNKIEKYNMRMSQRWTYKMMDLNDGYYVVRLGAQEALNYENRMLRRHAEIYYNDDVYERRVRYSVRKGYTPVLTLEVNDDKVVKCCGYKDAVPCDEALRKAVRTFMHEQNLTIPDNGWNKLIAYIKQDGIVYDIFDLPKNFVLRDALNLEEMGLNELPNMSTVTINGNLFGYKNNLSSLDGAPCRVLENCDFSQNPLKSLHGMPRHIGGMILLSGHELTAESFVPIYLENKLNSNDVLGVDKKVIEAWKKQIAQRKTGLANIISSLYNHK